MADAQISLSGMTLSARPSGALWWPDASILTVSDLHLGRSERLARRGDSLLPPYDSFDTIQRLESEIAELAPRSIICLGDSFDDGQAAHSLDEQLRHRLSSLMSGRRWIWIAGNHDPQAPHLGGSFMEEVMRGPLTFRHIAQPRAEAGEVSGHFHPKIHVSTRAGRVTRPCFVADSRRLILPAFGTYTGGLSCAEEVLQALFGPDAVCILTGRDTTVIPMAARQTA